MALPNAAAILSREIVLVVGFLHFAASILPSFYERPRLA